jgi:hypothetical protein
VGAQHAPELKEFRAGRLHASLTGDWFLHVQ